MNLKDIMEKESYSRELFHSLVTNDIIHNISDIIPFSVFAIDEHGKVILWSKGMERLFKVKKEDIINKTNIGHQVYKEQDRLSFVNYVIEENWTEIKKKYTNFKKVAYNTYYAETFISSLQKHFSLTVSVLTDLDDTLIGAVEIVSDITQQVHWYKNLISSKGKYESLFNHSNEAILLLNKNMNIVDCNLKAGKLFGFLEKKNLLKKNLYNFFPVYQDENSLSKHIWEMKVTILKKDEYETFRWKFNTDDDTERFVGDTTLTKVELEGKIYFYLMIRDITQVIEKEDALNINLDNSLKTLGSITQFVDSYTHLHQKRTAILCRLVAERLGLRGKNIRNLIIAARLHDIGKISVPSSILNKYMPLSPIEFELIKSHPELSFNIIKNIELDKEVYQYVIQHHEKLDGSGYPYGIKGDQILFGTKILTLCDILESLISHRPYRPAFSNEKAIEIIEEDVKNGKLDEEVWNVTKKLLQKGLTL